MTFHTDPGSRPRPPARLSIGDAMDRLVRGGLPLHFTAYDGSSAGPPDADVGMQLRTERGLAYLMTAPGDLGMARAYVSGDLQLSGVHPGDPYDALVLLKDHTKFRVPAPSEAVAHRPQPRPHAPAATAPRHRRSTCPAGAARWRGCGTR